MLESFTVLNNFPACCPFHTHTQVLRTVEHLTKSTVLTYYCISASNQSANFEKEVQEMELHVHACPSSASTVTSRESMIILTLFCPMI